MGIAVEDPVTEDHRHPGLGHHVRQPSPLVVRELLGVEVGDLRPLQELERQHPRPGVAPVDARHAHVWVACEVPVEGAGIARLLAVVELLAHRASELVDEAVRVDEVECAHSILRDLRRLVQQREVGLDLPRRRRPLHLHRDAPAVRQHGRVHLADRRGGDRPFRELEEQALDRLPQLLADDVLDIRERKRADLVLELAQLDDDVRRDDVGPAWRAAARTSRTSGRARRASLAGAGLAPMPPLRPATRSSSRAAGRSACCARRSSRTRA